MTAVDFGAVPRHTYAAGTRLVRVHWATKPCWYFSGDGEGRFDPKAIAGAGACYFGEKPLGAWIEVFRTRMTITEDEVARRRLASITLNRDLEVVDLTARRALREGVTNSLVHADDYSEAWSFAADAVGAGVLGVRWYARHDPSARLRCVALFGREGGVDWQAEGLPEPAVGPLGKRLLARANREFGYEVLPAP